MHEVHAAGEGQVPGDPPGDVQSVGVRAELPSSWLAAPKSMSTFSPSGIVTSCTVTGRSVVRANA